MNKNIRKLVNSDAINYIQRIINYKNSIKRCFDKLMKSTLGVNSV